MVFVAFSQDGGAPTDPPRRSRARCAQLRDGGGELTPHQLPRRFGGGGEGGGFLTCVLGETTGWVSGLSPRPTDSILNGEVPKEENGPPPALPLGGGEAS